MHSKYYTSVQMKLVCVYRNIYIFYPYITDPQHGWEGPLEVVCFKPPVEPCAICAVVMEGTGALYLLDVRVEMLKPGNHRFGKGITVYLWVSLVILMLVNKAVWGMSLT